MSIGERLAVTLKGARISPRVLGAVTSVHYTTIYKLKANPQQATFPVVEKVLTETLDKIDALIKDNKLPFTDSISDKEKTDRLASMLAPKD